MITCYWLREYQRNKVNHRRGLPDLILANHTVFYPTISYSLRLDSRLDSMKLSAVLKGNSKIRSSIRDSQCIFCAESRWRPIAPNCSRLTIACPRGCHPGWMDSTYGENGDFGVAMDHVNPCYMSILCILMHMYSYTIIYCNCIVLYKYV